MPLFKLPIDENDKVADDQPGELARIRGVSPPFDAEGDFRSRTDSHSGRVASIRERPTNGESAPQLLASFPHLRGARGHVDADLEDLALLRTERVEYGVPSPAK